MSVQQYSLNTFLLKGDRKCPNWSGSVSVKPFLRIVLSRQIKTATIHILYLSLDSIYCVFQSEKGEIVSHSCLWKQLYCVAKCYSFAPRNMKPGTLCFIKSLLIEMPRTSCLTGTLLKYNIVNINVSWSWCSIFFLWSLKKLKVQGLFLGPQENAASYTRLFLVAYTKQNATGWMYLGLCDVY